MTEDDLQGLEDFRCTRCGRKDSDTLSGALICADCSDVLEDDEREEYLYG